MNQSHVQDIQDPGAFFQAYWARVAAQDRQALGKYFTEDARVRWHCSDEEFTLEEFLSANCDYPGAWRGEVQRVERTGTGYVTAARVWSGPASFHVVSFFRMQNGFIRELDEYWGDDGPAPQWRLARRLGRPIGGG